jgi:hypothetical protein
MRRWSNGVRGLPRFRNSEKMQMKERLAVARAATLEAAFTK